MSNSKGHHPVGSRRRSSNVQTGVVKSRMIASAPAETLSCPVN